MSYRNFTKKEVSIQVTEHPKFETLVSVRFSPEDRQIVIDALIEVKNQETRELRIDFPNQLTLFFKIREGESRILVARPELDSCVGTLALSATHFSALIGKLQTQDPSIDVSTLEAINRMSNLEVRIQA